VILKKYNFEFIPLNTKGNSDTKLWHSNASQSSLSSRANSQSDKRFRVCYSTGGGEGGAVAGGTTVTLKGFKATTHDDTIKDYIQNRKVAGSKTIKQFTRSGSTATIVFNEAAGLC
jgi:hypothetical protein